MTYTILFPGIFGEIDPEFAEDESLAVEAGFDTAYYTEDKKIRGKLNEIVIYRGWMLTVKEYDELSLKVEAKGSRMFTSVDEYSLLHYIPNWIKITGDLSMKTKVLSKELNDLKHLFESEFGKNGLFLKDYVKSLKTARGSLAKNFIEAEGIIFEMLRVRGQIEGGIVAREPVKVIDERRFFVFYGKLFPSAGGEIPSSVMGKALEVVKRMEERAKFFCFDIGRTVDHGVLLIEMGDAQVSDFLDQRVPEFYPLLKKFLEDFFD